MNSHQGDRDEYGVSSNLTTRRPTSLSSSDSSTESASSSSPPVQRLLDLDLSHLRASKESILDDLLSDIRRSCATSLASTPTAASPSEDENSEGAFFDCKMKRSRFDMMKMDVSKLEEMVSSLQSQVECTSSFLIRLLQVKDKHALRASKQSKRLTTILRHYAKKNGLCHDLSFSTCPPLTKEAYQQWLNAWKVLSRLPKGVPKSWRKELWTGIVTTSDVSSLNWPSIYRTAFSEYATPRDDALGVEIIKDLHRTGHAGFTTEEERAVLKRVLLAYARFNEGTGYCQGFNILAALILKVVCFDEKLALKVMIHLVDYVLPENYFAQNLHALSVDMATFRALLKHVLPELSEHVETLQKETSGTIKKAYSRENPPDPRSAFTYEPPLADVFSMQWFLTIFASALPRKAVRQVWDFVLLDGSEALLYTGVAVMAVMERDLLQTTTAADFYITMANLGEKLRKSQLLPSSELMEVIYMVQNCVCRSTPPIPTVNQLREKYAYNIRPCAGPEDEELMSLLSKARPCPKPSQGGSVSCTGPNYDQRRLHGAERDGDVARKKKRVVILGQQKSLPLPKETRSTDPLLDQVKLLQDHYLITSQHPPVIQCAIDLPPPTARIVCPQTKYKSVGPYTKLVAAYGPDVPDSMVQKGKELCRLSRLEEFSHHRDKSFTISYSSRQTGVDIGRETTRRPKTKSADTFEGRSGILGTAVDQKTRGRYHRCDPRWLVTSIT